MPLPTFHDWLQSTQEAPAADRLATVIAQSGAAGVSLDRVRRVVALTPEILADVLKALVAGGQVTMLKVGGKTVYRVAG
jgi:hypothetical protein